MTDSKATDPSTSFCQIAGCAGPSVKEVWSVDENRHLQVCWKHTEDEEKAGEDS